VTTPGPTVDGTSDEPVRLAPTEVRSRVARRREAARPVAGRTPALVIVAVVVLGVAGVSALFPPPAAPSAPPAGDGVAVAPIDAHASSFFCTTGAGTDAGVGATGLVSAVSVGGGPVQTRITVPGLGSIVTDPSSGLPAGAVAASFSFAGGGVSGSVVVASAQGWSTAPCATEVSPEWDFAGGSTASGLLDLSLYNPTAAPAVSRALGFVPGSAYSVPPARKPPWPSK